MEQELAVAGDLVADEQVEVAEAEGEQQPHQGRCRAWMPGRARPARAGPVGAAGVALAGRVVELVLLAPRRRCSRARPARRSRSAAG